MCIGIYKPIDGHISRERLFQSYQANPDGCGILWSAHGNLSHVKAVMTFDEFYLYYSLISKHFGCIIHFRTASSGNISDKHCHPFFVNKNLGFVENGNLFEFAYGEKGKTDIERFNEQILQVLPDSFLQIRKLRELIDQYCHECMTKMIFMDALGRVDIINQDAGEWVDGCWYSNGGIKEYIGYGYSGAYYSKPGEIRHKGGMISNRLMAPSKWNNWHRCDKCEGWFTELENGICASCQTLEKLKEWCG